MHKRMAETELGDRIQVCCVLCWRPSSALEGVVARARFQSEILAAGRVRNLESVDELQSLLTDEGEGIVVDLTVLVSPGQHLESLCREISSLSLDALPYIRLMSSNSHLQKSEDEAVLVAMGSSNVMDVQNGASKLLTEFGGSRADIHSATFPLYFPSDARSWTIHRSGLRFGSYPKLRDEYAKFVLDRHAYESRHDVFRAPFWKRCLSTAIPAFTTLEQVQTSTSSADTLFIFPERMLPLKRAFFSRGLDLLCNLAAQPGGCDLLLFGPPNDELTDICATLSFVANRVYGHPLVRGQFGPADRARRVLEKNLRKRRGAENPPPIRFDERQRVFASSSQKRALRQVLDERTYKNVVITGAWLMGLLDVLTDKERARMRIACDTHDVFYVVDTDANRNEARFFYLSEEQKRLEIAALEKSDVIVAISRADAENIKKAGVETPVLVASGTFEHAAQRAPGNPSSSTFGFIGSGNKNNQRAIEVLTEWWSSIISNHPNVSLMIAGPVCETDAATRLQQQFPDSVNLAGFVPDLGDFYSKIDALIAPAVVQGGLNFKSVEALMCGRPVFTNDVGKRCLEGCEGVWGSKEPPLDEIRAFLSDADPEASRIAIRRSALSRFSETTGYRELDAWLQHS